MLVCVLRGGGLDANHSYFPRCLLRRPLLFATAPCAFRPPAAPAAPFGQQTAQRRACCATERAQRRQLQHPRSIAPGREKSPCFWVQGQSAGPRTLTAPAAVPAEVEGPGESFSGSTATSCLPAQAMASLEPAQ